jgi:hypothetical protein
VYMVSSRHRPRNTDLLSLIRTIYRSHRKSPFIFIRLAVDLFPISHPFLSVQHTWTSHHLHHISVVDSDYYGGAFRKEQSGKCCSLVQKMGSMSSSAGKEGSKTSQLGLMLSGEKQTLMANEKMERKGVGMTTSDADRYVALLLTKV